MSQIGKQMSTGALILGLFAILGSAMVATTYRATHAQIAENERQAILRTLHQIIQPTEHDNDIERDTIVVSDPLLDPKRPVTIYRARREGRDVAALITPVAPDGYGGRIHLLVGIRSDATLAGVRVISHRETPGLGDGIEAERSDWIRAFDNLSLFNPDERGWRVKKDGGRFDQFTGATITPRAIVAAVRRTLIYYDQQRDAIYAPAPRSGGSDDAR